MLHLLPQAAPDAQPVQYAEAVSRLASVGHALRLVGDLGDGPAEELDSDAVARAWDEAGEARQRWFDRRSERLVSAAAAGVQALADAQQARRMPNQAASRALVEEIRRELRDVAGIVLA